MELILEIKIKVSLLWFEKQNNLNLLCPELKNFMRLKHLKTVLLD